MSRTEGFVEALLTSPLGVALLGLLEAGANPEGDWIGRSASPSATAATVATAVDTIGSMSFGQLVDAAAYASVSESGPWIAGAALNVANAYRNAEARTPIAEAIEVRFGEALHAPLERAAQQWWADEHCCREVAQRFVDFDDVYGAGQFTWAGLWTVTDPPREAHEQLVAAWEYEVGPVVRWWLPVRPDARVFEVHRPEDWARLVIEHPREGCPHPEWELPGVNQDQREVAALEAVSRQRGVRTSIRHHLVPDWRSVASRYDGIHLSWAGFITSEGYISDLGEGDVAMLRYWFSEHTLWLADVFGEPRPAPPPALGDGWGRQPITEPLRSRSPGDALLTLLGR